DIALEPAVRRVTPEDLLAARQGRLARRTLAARTALVLLKLVRAIERRRIARHVEGRADAEAVDRRAVLQEPSDVVLVEAAADEDADPRARRAIENSPHGARQGVEITAVDADGRDGTSLPDEALGELDDAFGGRLGVVRVDQQHGVAAIVPYEVLECRDLGLVRFDVRMRHGPEDRNPEQRIGEDRGRAVEAREITGACREHAGLGAVSAPKTEIDEPFAARGEHETGGLRRDHRLEVQEIDEARLDELRFRQRRRHAHDRLVRKADRALWHRIDVAGEAQPLELGEETIVEEARRGEMLEVRRVEAERREVIHELLETRRDEEVSRRRKAPHEELEYGLSAHAAVEVRLQHRELVEVREQRARQRETRARRHRIGPADASSNVLDWISVMPRLRHAAPSDDGSTARVRSQMIVVSKPRSTASSAVHFTQKSRASPHMKIRS